MSKEISKLLHAKQVIVPEKGHLNSSAGMNEFKELKKKLKRWMKSILGYSTQINYKNYLIVKAGIWIKMIVLGIMKLDDTKISRSGFKPVWHEDFYEKAIRQYVNELEKF